MADRGLNVKLPDNSSFSDYFHLLLPENLFNKIATKQINIKQSHLNSKEIVCLSTQGSEIGLRMTQHLVRWKLFSQ